MPQVTLPVVGVAYNVNAGLGHDGIVGVKTGSTSAAGRCLAFAAIRTVAGGQPTIVGVVLGVPATPSSPASWTAVITAAENLLASIGGDLEHAEVIRPGAVRGTVSSAWTAGPAAVAATGVAVTGWPGTPVTISVTPRPLAHAISQGQPVAQATVTIGSQVRHISLYARPRRRRRYAGSSPGCDRVLRCGTSRAQLTGMVPGIPLANGSRNRDPHRSQAVARGPVNGSRARTADRGNAEPSPISATTASARRPATLAGCPGRAGRGPPPWRPRSLSPPTNTPAGFSAAVLCRPSARRTPRSGRPAS
jgi:hypothetical protein